MIKVGAEKEDEKIKVSWGNFNLVFIFSYLRFNNLKYFSLLSKIADKWVEVLLAQYLAYSFSTLFDKYC